MVVDNGSRDGSVAALAGRSRRAACSTRAPTSGYAAAANRGIAATDAPVVAVCNPDLVVASRHGGRDARPASTPNSTSPRSGPRCYNPDGTQYPSARPTCRRRRRRSRGVRARVARQPLHPSLPSSSTPTGDRHATSTGSRARWLVPPARRSIPSAVGTSATSCTWRTSTCAGGSGGLGWRVAYEPAGSAVHVQGVSTAARPFRMIIEHHRSVYRFADRRWHGIQRWKLLPTAVFLVVRGAIDVAGACPSPASRIAEGQRVTCDSPCPSPAPAERAAMRSKYRKPKRNSRRVVRLERRHRGGDHRRDRVRLPRTGWRRQRRQRAAPRRRCGGQRSG